MTENLINLLSEQPNIYCRENGFKKKFPEDYENILKINFPENFKFSQKIYHYINNDCELKLGICKYCHTNRCVFKSLFAGYRDYCSNTCAQSSPEIREKIQDTLFEHYGVRVPLHSPEIRQRSIDTCLKRYGVDNVFKNKEIQEKQQQTCLRIYGCKNVFQNEDIKQKIKETCRKKYNVDNYSQTKECHDKIEATCLKRYGVKHVSSSKEWKDKLEKSSFEKYGVKSYFQTDEFKEKSKCTCKEKYKKENYTQTEEFKEKAYNTKKKNRTFNSSKIEEDLYKWFSENNIKAIRQYKSELYPFPCDFYLPDYDLYIEIQGHWSHGQHPFNENDIKDIELLNMWKEKSSTSKYYRNAIDVWSKRDILKRDIAKKNELNYLEVFSTELYEVVEVIHKYNI